MTGEGRTEGGRDRGREGGREKAREGGKEHIIQDHVALGQEDEDRCCRE